MSLLFKYQILFQMNNDKVLLLSHSDGNEYIDVYLKLYPEPPSPNPIFPEHAWYILGLSGFYKDGHKCQYSYTMIRRKYAERSCELIDLLHQLLMDFYEPIDIYSDMRDRFHSTIKNITFDIRKELANVTQENL